MISESPNMSAHVVQDFIRSQYLKVVHCLNSLLSRNELAEVSDNTVADLFLATAPCGLDETELSSSSPIRAEPSQMLLSTFVGEAGNPG